YRDCHRHRASLSRASRRCRRPWCEVLPDGRTAGGRLLRAVPGSGGRVKARARWVALRGGGGLLVAIIEILAPVFVIIGLGWGLTRTGFLGPQALGDLNRLTYWIGLPAMLFYRIAAA